ncbi:asparaginase [Sinomonas halotolerans]|uniref:Asparaginase n=1 Tax=Sinomonas halotolerans TaxID=1644133 RepID=A0ABU9WWX5_9MICC
MTPSPVPAHATRSDGAVPAAPSNGVVPAAPSAARGHDAAAPAALPAHVPLAVQSRGGLVESVHYGSIAATGSPDAGGSILWQAGDPGPFYPRSALKPLQAVALVRAGLRLEDRLLALAAASHSGGPEHRDGALEILRLHGLGPSALANTTDLPYGAAEREAWLRASGGPDQLCQNCSGKHAAMAAVCTLNDWPIAGYLDPAHPLQRLVAATVAELTGETPEAWSTDGCGTPVPAVTLAGMARAYGLIARAAAGTGARAHDGDAVHPGAEAAVGRLSPEAAVGRAMRTHPEMVAGEDRDVTALMRVLPGAVAKDGFEGVQLVGLPDGRALALKVADGGDRARMPITVRALAALGVPEALDGGALVPLARPVVLGGGRPTGSLVALDDAFPAQ